MIRPMLAQPSTASGTRRGRTIDEMIAAGYVFDLKVDGIRVLAEWDGHAVTLFNRNGEKITTRFPEVVERLRLNLSGNRATILDGEIVANDGRFETTLKRDKNGGRGRDPIDHPCTFWAFDILKDDDEDLTRLPWTGRREALDSLAAISGVSVTPTGTTRAFVDKTRELGLEGVIAKNPAGRYQAGKRSAGWIKFKNLNRVTCVISGYSPGNGQRADIGALHLAMLDKGLNEFVDVGRVGTGFTMTELCALKTRIDDGEFIVAEIECLNRTSGGTLRFPVWKGERSDLKPTDCVSTQLDSLPLS